MNKKSKLLKDTFLLGITNVGLNAIGMIFQIYISGVIGTDGVGLFQLISSVYVFVATFATSGISLSVTRIIAETVSTQKTNKGISAVLARCMGYCVLLGVFASVLLYFIAPAAGKAVSDAPDIVICFRILSFGLPFMSVSSCLNGFFIAERKAVKSAASYLFESIVQVIAVFVIFTVFPPGDDVTGCIIITVGIALKESLSCIFSYILYLFDKRRTGSVSERPVGVVNKLLHIGGPVAASSYLRSGLTTLENLLIPVGLQKYGMTEVAALSVFGVLKGLAVPALFFPAAFLGSFTKVLVPEIADFHATRNDAKIKDAGGKILGVTLTFSAVIAGIFAVFFRELGYIIFPDPTDSIYLVVLAPLIPMMYLDGVVDGILKGMDEQFAVMRYNVYEAVIRVMLVYLVLPYTGTAGFILTIYAGNAVNALLSLIHLIRKTHIKIRVFDNLIYPLLSVIFSGLLSYVIFARIMHASPLCVCLCGIPAALIICVALLCASGCIDKNVFIKRDKKTA